MIKNKVPIYGELTDEQYTWWERGARAEHDTIHEGMTEDNRQVYDYVEIMAQQGRGADEITDHVASIFTCEWPLCKRLALAWKIVKPLHWRLNPFRWLGNELTDLWRLGKPLWIVMFFLVAISSAGGYAVSEWLR